MKKNKTFSSEKNGWVILVDEYRVYLNFICDTKEEAIFWMEDMLKPYPNNDQWRKRISVAYWPIKRKTNFIKFVPKPLEELCQDPEEKILSYTLTPYGYKRQFNKSQKQIIENPKEQKIIKQIYNYHFVDGKTVDEIFTILTSIKIKNRNGKYFTRPQILKIIDRFVVKEAV